HPACPPPPGEPDAGATPPGPAVAEAAGELRGADRAAALGPGARDVYPAGQRGRDGQAAQPVVPGRQAASRSVPAPGDGHRPGIADGLPKRACPEALDVQAAERVTEI